MNVDFRLPVGTPGAGPPGSSERGFSALELLVIVVIVCVLVAIGVPALHSRAKASVLSANLQSLGSLVNEQVMEGYSTEYRQSGEGDPSDYLSTHLEESLSTAGKAGYANPVVGSVKGRVVLNSGGSCGLHYQFRSVPVSLVQRPTRRESPPVGGHADH
jgi:type II secretory pathway pseudopilin PulG